MVVFHSVAHAQTLPERPTYTVRFKAALDARSAVAEVEIRLSRRAEWVHWMLLRVDGRYSDFRATGHSEKRSDGLYWEPPEKNAVLSFKVNLKSKRSNGRFDGYRESDWMLFRLDDLVPRIRIDMEDGTQSYSTLELELPKGWRAALPYPRFSSGRYQLDRDSAWFDRPSGWMIAGNNIGIRRETIGTTRVTIASPGGQQLHRMDVLSFLHRNLPEIQRLLPDYPDRVLIVGAGDPMWRGALSGPRSLFLHADRPLISEDGTSTVIHELIHVGMSARGEADADWLVEGLAEYYALTLLGRSGDLPEHRVEQAFTDLAGRADNSRPLTGGPSAGRITARAVIELRDIDREIRSLSAGAASLDDVVRALARERRPISNRRFTELVEQIAGAPSPTLQRVLAEPSPLTPASAMPPGQSAGR